MTQKATGFASPAQGYEEQTIDLNRLLIRNPPATIFVLLDSNEMADLGLSQGTLLVVDRSKTPEANSLVMLRHEGHFLCRLLTKKGKKAVFTNGNEEFYPIENETEVIGVVTSSIKIYNNVPKPLFPSPQTL